jgi:4,5-dihydroxyphthalate decarboxylase
LFFGPQFLAKSREIVGDDPFTYGVGANRKMIETMIEASHEQGLTARKLATEELFAASTLEV